MGRIGERFSALKESRETALVAFVTAGDPDLATTGSIIMALAEAGADLIELGVPFSDPIGEGPTIQKSSERALAKGTSLRSILGLVGEVRADVDIPLLLMGYANPIHAMGPGGFADAASSVGVDGIIVPDLPPEDGRAYYDACREKGVDPVLLSAPTSSKERLKKLVEETSGFLYHVSVQGVTGSRETLSRGIQDKVELAKSLGDVPICVGFGISEPEQAAEIGRYADGVVVGSAFVQAIEGAQSASGAVDAVAALTARLKAPLRG